MDHRVETRNTSEYSTEPRNGNIERRNSEFLPPWKFWSISALSLLTLVLLFQPWLTASGPHGDVQSDAFGRLDGSVPALRNVGERLTEGVVSISGLWGMLAAAAAVITVAAACSYRFLGVGSSVVAVAGTANIVLVPVTLLYLNGKTAGLREMTEYHDELKTSLGDVLSTLIGGTGPTADTAQRVATAALTNQALICVLIVVLTAVLALSAGSLTRRIPGDTGVRANGLRPDEADRVWIGIAETRHADDAGLEEQLDLVLHYTRQLPDAVQYVYDDDHGIGHQRLLARAESPRKADSQFGPVRRERQTTRRRRPRPANRTPAVPQTPTGTAAAAKRSGSNCGSPRSARPVIPG